MNTLSVDNLLGIKYLKKEDLDLIFETTNHFKEILNRKINTQRMISINFISFFRICLCVNLY